MTLTSIDGCGISFCASGERFSSAIAPNLSSACAVVSCSFVTTSSASSLTSGAELETSSEEVAGMAGSTGVTGVIGVAAGEFLRSFSRNASLFFSSVRRKTLIVVRSDLFGLQSSAAIGVCSQTGHVEGKDN